jgi:hypothetical protein
VEGYEKEDGFDGQLAAEVEEMDPAVRDHGFLEAGYYSKKKGGPGSGPPQWEIRLPLQASSF